MKDLEIEIIDDFVEDLNYRNIFLNLKYVDKDQLKLRLEKDLLNKLWRLEKANYLWVENCDYQGEEIETEEDVAYMMDDDYVEYYLFFNQGLGYFISDMNL